MHKLLKLTKTALVFIFLPLSLSAQIKFVPGEFVVKLNDSSDLRSVSQLKEALNVNVKSVIHGTQFIVVKMPAIQTLESSIAHISRSKLVEYVEPNFIYEKQATPNDPMFKDLWGLKNSTNAGVDVSAETAWDITTDSKTVIVAVIDTGIDHNHPDLKSNMWTNNSELNGKVGVDDDRNGIVDDIYGANFTTGDGDGNSFDDHSHGTHCAGTIGASGNNGIGVAGVAWNTKLMGVKFLSASGSGTLEGAVKAIKYAVDNGANVLSNSWGGGGYSQALKEVIEYSAEKGAIFIAAAGNSSANNDSAEAYPANYDVPNVVSVAAVSSTGALATFSSYGKKKVHLAAPGVNVLSTVPNNKYAQFSGTSMATPHVSGVAALVWGNEPELTAVQLKERLVKTVSPLASVKAKTISGGMVNAYNALSNTVAPPDLDDPANWSFVVANHSTKHPYDANTKQEFEIEVSGAREISIYFEKFDTEINYDFARIVDKNGIELAKISGLNDGTYSGIIRGNYAKVIFTSDNSVQRYGFDITKISYR